MSRSNNTELINPAVKFFDWSGSDGELQYFDKSLGEKGEKVSVELPFTFLILDRVYQVTGGIDDNNGYLGFWSNSVKNLKTQKLTVKSKRGVEAQGFYEHIKGVTGVKFMTGLYVAFKNDGELQIGYLKLKGAALTAWIEFTKQHRNLYEGAFQITGSEKKKKGSNSYFEPTFSFNAKISPETEATAQQLDEQLQEYLTAYFANAGINEAEQEYSGSYAEPTASVGDAYEPEPLRQAKAAAARSTTPVEDLDSIPF